MLQKAPMILDLKFTTTLVYSANSPLSVYVLNTQDELPSSNIPVILEQVTNGKSGNRKWIKLSSAFTDKHGCITALYPEGKIRSWHI